ncbi:hypothetical protein GCM10028805_22790 [Spirosoma harenae]
MTPQLFNFQSTRIRVIQDEQGNVWFVARDICGSLGYKQSGPAVKKHCRIKGVMKHHLPSNGGSQFTTLINEGNLYRLIANSTLPSAEKFEEWVFDEVLPSIRKTGGYFAEKQTSLESRVTLLEAQVAQLQRQLLDKVSAIKPVKTLPLNAESLLVQKHFQPSPEGGQLWSVQQVMDFLSEAEKVKSLNRVRVGVALSQLCGPRQVKWTNNKSVWYYSASLNAN